MDSLNINSIDFIKIIVEIESCFGFEFNDYKLIALEFPTVKSIVDYVKLKTSEIKIRRKKQMNVDLSNKVVVITGASKGIGSELAKMFAYEKAIVVMNYYNSKDAAEELFNEIVKISPLSLLIRADVRNPTDVSAMYHEVVNKIGRIDILINNAGTCDDNLIQMMPIVQWQNVIDTNLTGAFLCSREFSKIMIRQNSGKIINIVSIKGQEGEIGQVNYSASKAGVIGLTKTLAKELGKYNVSVNAVCPGFVVTDLNKNNKNKLNIAEKRSLISISHSIEDVKNFILFISSDKLLGMSGRIINIDSRV